MKEVRLKVIAIILFILVFQNINSQITLSHNIGNTPITTKMSSCDYDEYWARVFTLSDFGISTSDQFLIKTGQIAISNAYNGASFGIELFRARVVETGYTTVDCQSAILKHRNPCAHVTANCSMPTIYANHRTG